MARPVLRTALVLMLGFCSTIAVAWTLAGVTPVPSGRRHTIGVFQRWDGAWRAVEAYRFGLVHIWWASLDDADLREPGEAPLTAAQIADRSLANIMEIVRTGESMWPLVLRNEHRPWGTFASAEPPPAVFNMGSDSGYGWPRPCMYYQVFTVYDSAAGSTVSDTLRGGHVLWGTPASRWDGYRALPLRPIYRGLAVNSLFYGLVWSILLFVPGLVRSRLRRRRGLCAGCGYDLRGAGAGPCPECGAAQGATAGGAVR